MKNNLDKAVSYFGSKAKIARALGISPMTVHQWTKRKIPVERAVQIERASKGCVLASDLRPDVFISGE